MTGTQIVFRYRAEGLGYRESEFSLRGSRKGRLLELEVERGVVTARVDGEETPAAVAAASIEFLRDHRVGGTDPDEHAQ